MPREVSALNTYWLVQYLETHHPTLNIEALLARIHSQYSCYVENLQTGAIEELSQAHLKNPRYWFSNQFVLTLHQLIQEQIPDPRLGFKIGSSMYATQPMIVTALGMPLLGTRKVALKVSKEAAKYNRTKQYLIRELDKGLVKIRILHNPGVMTNAFTMQWNAGCFASYARLSGAKNVSVDLECIDPGPTAPTQDSQAIWDFTIRYQEPGLFSRLAKSALRNLPGIRKLVERAEAIEDDHQEQIVNRDRIIRERTSELAEANRVMRQEISVRKQAEAALRQSKEQLQRYIAAIDDIGMGVGIIDADYRLREMNATLTAWYGHQQGERCHRLIMGQSSPCSHCRLPEVIEQGEKVKYLATVSQGRFVEIVATPITNPDGTLSAMAIFRDVTQQKHQEQQRLKTLQQQEQLKKFASLKNMAASIAHRFNNAMNGVQGNLELLTMLLPQTTDAYRMSKDAFTSAKEASQVGSMMLSYVGQNPPQPHTTALYNLVHESAEAIPDTYQQSGVLTIVPPTAPIYCSVDQEQIKEVIKNILLNAFEALEQSTGSITVTFGIDHVTTDALPLLFQGSSICDGLFSYCQVTDTGHGISPDNLARIFEPFYSTRFVGRGLGLALASGIVQAHGGAITVKSTPDRGTTVRMLLPLASATEQPATARAGRVEAAPRKMTGNILLVDDDPIVLEVGRNLLSILGCTVHTATNGREAVDQVLKLDGQCTAIIMDISMPVMNGIEAMEVIRNIAPAVPILLCSGYAETDFSFTNNSDAIPDGFLAKPFQLADVKSNLEILVGSHSL